MCKTCLVHGTAGKWYLNAENYSNEIVEKYNLRDFLMEQYKNFEQMSVRKVNGFNAVGLGYKLQMPMIGRIVKHFAEKIIHNQNPPTNPLQAQGHIGQVIPLEDGVTILETCAAEPIILKNCMCRYMSRGIKDACCINFGVMSEIVDKLPRFIPDDDKYFLTRKQAVEYFTKFNKKGYIGSIWYAPYPYINNLCSCATPECAGIRPRFDFGLKSIFKSEYLVDIVQDNCKGCKKCVAMCQFNALTYNLSLKRVVADLDKCYGCGVCTHACKNEAIYLKPRKDVPGFEDKY
jgi:NAD-dependent dihydropyrimidine dehydrogenase PreA subunit